MKKTLRTLCAFACALGSLAQTQIDLRTQGKDVDFSGASATKPIQTGSSLPSACNVGQLFFLTTAQAGQNVYACPSSGMWIPISATGGGAVTSVSGKTGNVILQASDLADCRLVLSSSTVLSFNACPYSYPDLPLQNLPAGSITILSGSGTIYVYATIGGAIDVLESGNLSIGCTGCTDAGPGNAFPPDVAQIGIWASTVTPGAWDPSGVADARTLVNGPPQLVSSTGVAIALNSLGQKSIGIDSAVVETRSAEQAGQEVLCTAIGTSSAQTCSLLPTLTAYTTGMRIRLLSAATNVGASALNIDGLGAKSVLRSDGVTPLVPGDLATGNYYDLIYDGTSFRLPSAATGTVSYGVTVVSADTTYTSTATPANVAGISYSLAASTQYNFQCSLTGNGLSGGLTFTPTYTGTVTSAAYSEYYISPTGTGITQAGGAYYTDLSGHANVIDTRSSAILIWNMSGSVTTNSAGTWTIQASQYAATSPGAVLHGNASWCRLTKTP